MSLAYHFSHDDLKKFLPCKSLLENASDKQEKMVWEDMKRKFSPYFEQLHQRPDILKRLSTDVIKENEKLTRAVLRYVLY